MHKNRSKIPWLAMAAALFGLVLAGGAASAAGQAADRQVERQGATTRVDECISSQAGLQQRGASARATGAPLALASPTPPGGSLAMISPCLDPYSYTIVINRATGKRHGLADGEAIRVETEHGRHVEGRVCLSEVIHPEGLGIAACAGHWAEGMPMAKGKGVFFNEFLELDWNHVSPINFNLDICAKVKVGRIGGAAR